MRFSGFFLRSAIGRRFFLLLLLAACLPAGMLAAITYEGVSKLLDQEVEADLSSFSKGYGMEVIARLRAARQALDAFGGAGRDGQARIHADPASERLLDFVARQDALGSWQVLAGNLHVLPEPIESLARRSYPPGHRAAGARVLALPTARSSEPLIAIAVDPPGGATRGRLLAVVQSSGLFGDREVLPARTDVCVIAGEQLAALYCSDRERTNLAQGVADRPVEERGRIDDNVDTGRWTLTRVDDMRLGPWTFVAMRPVQTGVLSDRSVGASYVKVTLACLVLVTLLSLTQIRRILRPLERMLSATRRIAGGDFSRQVPIEGHDEFGELATSFNEMAGTLGRQFATLRFLATIDSGILAAESIDGIVERVLAHAGSLIAAESVAIARLEADAGARSAALWYLEGGTLRKTDVPIAVGERSMFSGSENPTLLDAGDTGRSGLVRHLVDRGAHGCILLPSRRGAGACAVLALGFAEGALPDATELAPVGELAVRVGVAFDSAAWQRKLVDEARNDSLTGLPNRLRIHEAIEERLAASSCQGEPFAVLFIDLDRFKGVNDGLGHDAGDALLAQAARRIVGCVPAGAMVARLGGDEFIVLTDGVEPRDAPGALAHCIIEALSAPFHVAGGEVHVGATVGIAHAPADGTTREVLIRNADTAMYRAKALGRGRWIAYDEAMGRTAVEQLSLEKDLRNALERGEVGVHFQPRVQVAGNRIVGAEALARWYHPIRGYVPPAQFIGLAEEIGLIDPLGESILRQACALQASRRFSARPVVPVSVNVSVLQLRSRGFAQRIAKIVASYGLSPEDIELEITESAFVENLEESCAALGGLREAGFRIALDDFGTGYSSLSYLRNLPIDVMKVDQSFVMDIVTSAGSRAIAIAIIGMAKTLGIRVIAEGVETNEQAALLREWGCDELQGYLFSRPLATAAFERFLDTRLPAPAVLAQLPQPGY
jgi:diguanylate cyclase